MPVSVLDSVKMKELDDNIKLMINAGANENDVMKYSQDFVSMFGKKKDGGIKPVLSPQELKLEEIRRGLKEGIVAPQKTELPKQLQASKQRAEFEMKKEAETPVVKQMMVYNKPTFSVKYPKDQEITAKIAGFKSPAAYEEAKQYTKEEEKNRIQNAANEFYETSLGKLYFNVIQPITRSAEKNISQIGGTALRAVNLDDAANDLVDYFIPEKKYEGTIAGTTPTKLQGGLFDDKKNLLSKMPSTITRGITDMLWLLAPVGPGTAAGKAIGATEKAATAGSLFATSFLNTREGYYQEGRTAGLKGDELDMFASGAAAVTSGIESLFPNEIALGRFKNKLATEYAKQIANGITTKSALKAATKEIIKESFIKEPTQEILQLAGDKVARTISDISTGENRFGDQFDWDKSKNEVYETLLITPIISILGSGIGSVQKYSPSNYEKSVFYEASKDSDKVIESFNKQYADKQITEDQYKNSIRSFNNYNAAVNKVKTLGYSEDQTMRMAWEVFSGMEKQQANSTISSDPILNQALKTELKKDEESVSEKIKSIGLGVPDVGSEIDGKEVSYVISNIGDKGKEVSQSLVDEIGDDVYRVDEISVKNLYNTDNEFKQYVDSYQKQDQPSDGILVPAVIKDGKIIDGRARLAEQYLSGKDNVKVFNKLNDYATQKSQQQQQEGLPEGGVVQPARIEIGQPEIRQGEGVQGQATPTQADAGNRPVEGEGGVAPGRRLFNEPNPAAAQIETEFKAARNIQTTEPAPIRKLNVDRSKSIADAYAAMEDKPDDPEVKAAYEAMANETMDQFESIAKSGVKFEIWEGEGEPYASSEEMIRDVRDNKHMYILSTEKDFGQQAITDEQRQKNPLLRDSGVKDVNGKPLLINDVFRGVHDFFGHTRLGNSFGAIGEENAWNVHARMYSPIARRAMTTETRGQNSWVNFGPQMRNEDGSIKKPGDPGYLGPRERAFAEQKLGLLPEEFSNIEEEYSAKPEVAQAVEPSTAPSTAPSQIAEELRGELGMTEEAQADIDAEMSRKVASAEKSLASIGVKFGIVTTDEEVKALGLEGKEGIYVSKDGKIYINRKELKDALTAGVVIWHEASHPIMNIIRNTDRKRYDRYIAGMKEAAKTNPGIQGAIDWASTQPEYDSQEVKDDEAGVDVIARIAEGLIDLKSIPTSFKQSLIDFINEIAKLLGIDKRLKDSDTTAEFKRTAKAIVKALTTGADVADIVGAENVMMYELRDTREQFSNTSTQGRFTTEFFEDTKSFDDLVNDGFVVHNSELSDFSGETVVIHNPDSFSTGKIKFRDKDLVEGEGGIYFVLKYGDVWASSKQGTAKQMANLINESLEKSTDGKARIVLVKGASSKNLTSVKGAKALMGVLEILADDGLIPLNVFRKALNIAGKKYKINFDGRSDAKSIHKDIQDKFMNVSNSSFERRGDFAADVIDEIDKQIELFKENIPAIAESIGATRKMNRFSKASIIDSVAYATSERILREIPNSHVYAVIESSSPVTIKNVGKHESYPWHIVTEDGSKPVLYILKNRQYFNDVFVAAKNTEKVKSGERFEDVSRAGLAQRGMGLAKVEYREQPITQASVGNRKMPSAPEYKQRRDAASENLMRIFQRKNVPLTKEEAIEIVDDLRDWTDWYDGLAKYVEGIFGEYAADVLSLLPLSSQAANSVTTVSLSISNAERIYKGESPAGVAEYYGYVTKFLEGMGIKSDKMRNFLMAISGDPNAIAVDMHVWSIIKGRDPNKKSVNPKDKAQFDAAKEFVNSVAEAMGIEPRGVQAALWAANILRTGGKPDSYEQYFADHVNNKGLNERIQSWRDKGYQPFTPARKQRQASTGIQLSAGNRNLVQDAKLDKFMTEDGQGNYLFFHYSGSKFSKLDPNRLGANLLTGRGEQPGIGLSMMYTEPDTLESGVPSEYGYAIRVPMDKVYPFNSDPLDLYDEAEAEFRKVYGNRVAFDPNKQVGFISKVAAKNGYPVTVAEWYIGGRKVLRAQTTEKLPVEKYRTEVGNAVKVEPKFEGIQSNRKKGGAQASAGGRNLDKIISDAKANGTFMKAPNGKPTNLTEGQWAQVRTPEFKNWFGDWENDPANASKVVDENGEPLVVYHGGRMFDTFKKGEGFDSGIYFTDNSFFAEDVFANQIELAERTKNNDFSGVPDSMLEDGQIEKDYFKYAKVYDVYLNLRNPKVVDAIDAKDIPRNYGASNDGFIAKTTGDFGYKGQQFVAFNPNQIKSATENTGAFSTTDARIQASAGGRPEQSKSFKLAAFVMRKRAEGVEDVELITGIASVMPEMSPQEIKDLIDDPEGWLRNQFPNMTVLQRNNLVERAKMQNIYRGRQFGKPVDGAFTGLEIPRDKVDEYMARNTFADNKVKKWSTNFKNKFLDPARGLPEWVLQIKDFATGSKNIEIARAARTIERLKAAAKSINFSDWDAFSRALVDARYTYDMPTSELVLSGQVPAEDGSFVRMPESIASLPIEIVPFVYQMRGQIDNLTRDLIAFGYVTPEQAVTLEKNIGAYVNRSYKMYSETFYKPTKEAINAAVKYLSDIYIKQIATDKAGAVTFEEAREEALEKAKRDVDRILNKETNPYFNSGSVDRRNPGILKQRQDIPKEIRDVMGEYTDPGIVFMTTITKQAALKASSEFLSKLREKGMGTMFYEANTPNIPVTHTVQIASTGTESMSPLGGLYTTPEIAKALLTVEPTYNELTSAWMKLVGAVRWGKTVGSIATQMKNFESNLGFAVMNGLLMTGNSLDAFKSSIDYVKGQYSKEEIDALTEKMIKLNLVGQSVGARELASMLGSGDVHDIALDISLNPEGKWGKRVAKRINVFGQANKVYRLGDDFWKVYAYLNERELVSRGRFKTAYSALTKEQQDQVDAESSERVKSTWPTYDRVIEAAKYVSKRAPIFGNFISFTAESLRVLTNTIKLAAKDINDPDMRESGVRRMAGITAYLGFRAMTINVAANFFGFAASGVLGALFGDDEEERRKHAIKEALPAFMRTGDLLIIPGTTPNKFTVVDLSSLDPYGVVFKSINALTEGREGIFSRTMEPGVAASVAELFSSFLETEMTFETMSSIMQNRNSKTGENIILESDEFHEGAAKVGSYVWGQLKPSTYGVVQRLATKENKAAEGWAIFGARPYEVDLHEAWDFALSRMYNDMDGISREYNQIKYNKQSTPEEIKAAELRAENKKTMIIQRYHKLYQDFILTGADPKILDEKTSGRSPIRVTGFDKNTKNGIKTGIIKSEKLYK